MVMSPANASKLSGRYETEVQVGGKSMSVSATIFWIIILHQNYLIILRTGKSVPVLRSIRHAPQELVLQGSITPKKSKPTAADVDDLCDLFVQKVRVSPKKSSVEKEVTKKVKEVKVKDVKVKITPKVTSVSQKNLKATITKAVDADEAKENLTKALKAIQKKPVVKTLRFSDEISGEATKTSAKATPARRSARVSIGGRVSSSPTRRACLSPSL
jgi:hypothetical protein